MNKKSFADLYAVVLLVIFASTLVTLILTSSRIYENTYKRDDETYKYQLCTQYLSNKIHQNQREDSFDIKKIDDNYGLIIKERIDGEKYETMIYFHEGWLKELFTWEGNELDLSSGEKIIELRKFNTSIEYNRIVFNLEMANKEKLRLDFSMRYE